MEWDRDAEAASAALQVRNTIYTDTSYDRFLLIY